MTGQQLSRLIYHVFRREEPMFIRALQGHSGKNLEDTHHFCIILDSSEAKIP